MRTSLPAAWFGNTVSAGEKPGSAAVHRTGCGADDAVVEDAVVAADGRLAVALRIPGEADARGEVIPVVVVPLAALLDGEVVDLAHGVEVGRLVQGAGEPLVSDGTPLKS